MAIHAVLDTMPNSSLQSAAACFRNYADSHIRALYTIDESTQRQQPIKGFDKAKPASAADNRWRVACGCQIAGRQVEATKAWFSEHAYLRIWMTLVGRSMLQVRKLDKHRS
jgi:hypothetical protein